MTPIDATGDSDLTEVSSMRRLPSTPSRRRLQQYTRLGRVVPAVAVALFTLSFVTLASAGVIAGPSDDEYILDTAAINSAMSMATPVSGATILSADGLVSSVSLGQIDPSRFPQMCTYVDVLTSSGIPVTGLTADSFCVKQDGAAVGPFTVQQLSGDSCHTATCLVIDVSGSMANGGKLTAAKNAAIRFVRQMSMYDRTAVVKFSDCYTVVRNFTSDTTLLINSINALTSGGRTAYFDGVWRGASLSTTEFGSKAVIALTDGMENNSKNCGGRGTPDGLNDGFADDSTLIVNLALGAGIPIYNISLGNNFDPTYLIRLSNATGGAHYHAPTGTSLDSIYDAIKTRLCSRYLICYNSSDTLQNGGCHDLIVCHRNGDGSCTPCDTGSYCEKAPPVITRTPATIALDSTCVNWGTTVPLCAYVTDRDTPGSGLTVNLFYRNSNSVSYTSVTMARTDSLFCASVPSSQLLITGDSIQYYITASDGEQTVASPSNAPTGHHAFPICQNRPPRLTLSGDHSGDTTVYLCAPQEICIRVHGEDDDRDRLYLSKLSGAGYMPKLTCDSTFDSVRCFTPDTSGVYCFVFELDDDDYLNGVAEDDDDVDTVCVTVHLSSPPDVTGPADKSVFLCSLPATITVKPFVFSDPDNNILSKTTSKGTLSGDSVYYSATTSDPDTIIVTVTDSCGVIDKDTVIVTKTANSAPLIAFGNDTTVAQCIAAQICVTYALSDPDGLAGLVEALVSAPAGATIDILNNKICFTPAAAGSYTIIVKATDPCSADDYDTVAVTVDMTKPVLSCSGDELTCDSLEASATVTSTPSTGVSYLWSPAPASGQGTAVARYNAPGSKKVVVTFIATGCKDSCDAVITQNVTVPNANAGPDKVLTCAVTQINMSGSSATPGATFSWVASAGGNIVSGATTATPLVNAAGTYTLTVTDPANGCTATDAAIVTSNVAAPNANAGVDKVLTCAVTQVALSGSSTTPGATFAWVASAGGNIVSGAATATPLVDAAGTYTLTVTDPANGCTATDVALVTLNVTAPNADAGADKVLTCAVTQINLAGSSTTPGATFSWVASFGGNIVSGAATATPLVNAAGTYTVTVTDPANGCTATDVALVALNATAPNANAGADKVLTCAVTSINLSGSSTTPGATFSWVASAGGNIVSGAATAAPLVDAAGTYTLTVTDPANGCTATDIALVTLNVATPNAAAGPDKVLTCTVTSINLAGSSTTPGATYSWVATLGGNIVSGATTATPLVDAAGTYTLTVTDPANGCTATDVALVTLNATPPNANAGTDKVLTCSVTQVNLSGSSTTPGATFSWVASFGGNIVSGAATATPLVNAAGTYTLTVTDPANGCTATDVALVTLNVAAPNANAGPDKVLTCSVTQINLAGSSTTPGATFSWAATLGGNIVSGATTATPLIDAAGTYTLTVTDPANGCTATDVALVTLNVTPPNANAGPDKVLTCTVTQVNLAGSSTTPGATFSWAASGGGNIVSGATTATPLVDAVGTYTLTVTDPANGCTATDVALVTLNTTAPNADAGPDKVLTCAVTQINLSGSSTTPGATFSWVASLGGNIVSGASTATPLVDAAGTYTVTVTDPANGCTATDVALVTLSTTKPSLSCTGDELTCDSLLASATVTSTPSTGVTYFWYGSPVSGQGTANARFNSAGTKRVVVTITATGCSDSCDAVITTNTNNTHADAGPDKILTCTVTQVTLDGSSTTPGALFSWVASGGGNIVSGASTATPTVDAAGTYTLTVTNPANGCTISDVALVTQNIVKPNVSAGIDKILTCTVTQINLSGSSSTPGATFSWAASGGGNVVSGGTTATPLVNAAGTYVLTVTDPANGCTAADTALVSQNVAAPNADAGTDDVLTCTTTQVYLLGSSTTPYATFSWVASAGGNIVSGANTETPLVDAAGTYTLTVTDPSNGCTASDVALVTLNIAPPNVSAGADQIITCAAPQTTLGGSSTTPGATFSWAASAGGNIVSGGGTATPVVDAAGTYELTVTDPVNGCTAKDTALVTANLAAPNADAGTDKVLTCTVTQINLSGSSSTPGATFSWAASAGGNIVSGATTAAPLVNAAGTYTLTVTDPANGCTAADVALVTQNITPPNADAGSDKALNCSVTQINLSGSSTTVGATFSWVASLGGNIVSGSATATPLVDAPGTYTLTVTDPVNGCTATDVALVTEDVTKPVLNCSGDELTCDSLLASADVTSTPSTGVSYVWSPAPISGQGTAHARYDTPGTKWVIVTITATGCKDSCNAVITQNITKPLLSCAGDELTCDSLNATASVSSAPSTGISYAWSPAPLSGQGTAFARYDTPGNKKVVVTILATGCKDSCEAVITQNINNTNANAGPDKVLTCTITSLALDGSSTTPGAIYSWAASGGGNIVSGAGTATPLVNAAGTYTLTVKNPANGCTATDVAIVTQNITPPNADAGIDKVLTCSVTQINLSGSSATPGATFSWAASAGGHIVSGATTATPLVDAAGTYTLTVTDPANGCTATDVALVTQNIAAPNANAGPDKVLTCAAAQVTLAGSSTTPGATFSWVAFNGGHIVSGGMTATALVDAAGSYSIVVTDPTNGCIAVDTALVTQNVTVPNASAGGDKVLTCIVTQVTLDGSSSTAGATFNWVASGGGHIVSGGATATPLADAPGTYTLTVTDPVNGCVASDVTIVTQNIAKPALSCSGDEITCDSLMATASVASTPSTGVTYLWSPAPASGQGTAFARYNTPGNKTVFVTITATGCTDSCIAVINYNVNGANANAGPDKVLTCLITQVTLNGSSSTPGAQYSWAASGGGNIVSGGTTPTPVVNAGGTYTLTVKNPANGCTATDDAVVTVTPNSVPTISFGADINLMQCTQTRVCVPYSVSDPDGMNGLVESFVSGPPGATIDTAQNEMCFIPIGTGTYTLVGKVTDGCGISDYDTVNVIITCIQKPELTPPVLRFNYLCSGLDTTCVPLSIMVGPNDQICTITATGFPGVVSISPTQICVACDETTYDTVTIIVTACSGLADTVTSLVTGACSSCLVTVSVGGPDALAPVSQKSATQRATPAGTIPALSGQTVTMPIMIDGLSVDIGGFDLLLCYDPTALRLTGVNRGAAIAEWEYFTYRFGSTGNCGGPCPTGMIHLVALADLDNGPALHPSPASYRPVGSIADLTFVVTSDRNFIDQCIAINFCSFDCTDNIISSKTGDTAFVEIDGIEPACLSNPKPGFRPRPAVCFSGGTIGIIPPPDDRGDLNLDGVANSVADAVLFSRYFIEGIGVLSSDPALKAVQILSTDINDDGIVLTVADLVYLIRIITGDAQPFPAGGNPKLAPFAQKAEATVQISDHRALVSTNSLAEVGAALLTFRYSGLTPGTPALSAAASQMVLTSKATNGELRVLLAPATSVKGARIAAGVNEILSIPVTGEGTIELTDIQMSDAQGALLSTSVDRGIPGEYTLLQNYPNPFNAGTVIQFSLKEQTDWKLSVYNITGQTVRTFAGNGQGSVQVAWDGADQSGQPLASGVYFYRLEAKAFTATKKMILVK